MKFETPALLTSILKKAITIIPEKSIAYALEILLRYGIKHLVVVKNINIAVGILTEKDLTRVISVFSGRNIWDMKVDEFMSKDLVTVKENSSFYICAKLIKNYKIISVIVLYTDDTIAGIITKTDLVAAFLIHGTIGTELL